MEKEQACIQTDWAEVLRTKGIRARGYGIVPKYAMQDTDLELTDKALYAYLCSLPGCLYHQISPQNRGQILCDPHETSR